MLSLLGKQPANNKREPNEIICVDNCQKKSDDAAVAAHSNIVMTVNVVIAERVHLRLFRIRICLTS